MLQFVNRKRLIATPSPYVWTVFIDSASYFPVHTRICTWASAHRDKLGQLTPWKMDEKLKSENMQKEQFSVFMLYFESNQGRQM